MIIKKYGHLFICRTLLMIFVLTIIGCSTKVVVDGYFPKPILKKMPLRVGIIFDPAFSSYSYIETDELREDKEIIIGQAQVKLFTTILTGMFEQVKKTQEVAGENETNFDMYFHPTVDEFQYNVPIETKINMFEVWIKYHLKVFDSQGHLIADWIQTAYGKTPTAMFKSEEEALNEAMVVALRDIGAGLALRFHHVPEIKQWLKDRKQMSVLQWIDTNNVNIVVPVSS